VYRLLADHPSVLDLLVGARDRRGALRIGAGHLGELLRRAGLDGADALRAQTALIQYTLGVALWAERAHERAHEGEPRPCAAEAAQRAPSCAAAAFEYGLDALLDGLLGPDGGAARGAGQPATAAGERVGDDGEEETPASLLHDSGR
jgi:hypothetical protein